MIGDFKEVYYSDYCKKCKYEKASESADPCWDCLNEPFNQDSHKPVKFKEKDDEHISVGKE